MKYIDADKLIANLERQNVDKKVIEPVIRIIDSLQQEQQEIDLEKDVESWFFNEISSKINVEHTMYYYFQECARRYFERGKNSK